MSDLIRREDVQAMIVLACKSHDRSDVIMAIRRGVKNIPSVDAVPVVHARWVKMTGMMPPEYHGHYECSECKWHMKGLRNSWTREEELYYCPNCGAKMDGGTEL